MNHDHVHVFLAYCSLCDQPFMSSDLSERPDLCHQCWQAWRGGQLDLDGPVL